ncbi:MAG: outer membrane protein assembly factor BamA, partial [Rikenellaceae bacterium]|nr:outer membrane protein assembly factor BamA [Rikenellaceae bacterium]
MNKIKALLFLVFSMAALSGAAQFNDTSQVVLPSLDYSNPRKYNIKDIKVTGVKYISPELIINASGLRRGDSVYLPSDYISNALQLLWSQRYYSNVRAIVTLEGDDAFLEIALKERPRVSVWNVEGVGTGDKTEILKRLKLRERTELSDYALKNSVDIIKRYCAEKGFLNAQVDIRQQNDSLLDNFVIVTFDVDKKSRVKIGRVRVTGNDNIPEKKLKTAMKKTRERSLINIFKSAKFDRNEYENNSKHELIDYMQGRGFRDARILSDSIYAINDKRIGIDINVDEGQKYYYRNISWVGNTKYSNEYLDQLLGIKKGDVYDKKTMESRLGLGVDGTKALMSGIVTVSSLYQNDGHLTYMLEPVETVVAGDSIDIELRMVEGKQFTVNDVIISGNNRTNDRVVRRELYVRPGELYDQSMLINTLNVIGSLNHFNPEAIVPDIQPVS